MAKIERNGFRKALKSRQAELENGSRNREALAIETSPEELDRIQHAQERDFAIDALDRDSMRLGEVRAALKRIDTDTFGICLDCEQDISMKRLAAVPWAELCIICQEAADNMASEPWDAAESPLASAAPERALFRMHMSAPETKGLFGREPEYRRTQ
jgi:DnaK suppressor protein